MHGKLAMRLLVFIRGDVNRTHPNPYGLVQLWTVNLARICRWWSRSPTARSWDWPLGVVRGAICETCGAWENWPDSLGSRIVVF